MKKKVAVLLAMAMAAGVLSGCGGSGGKEAFFPSRRAAFSLSPASISTGTAGRTQK